MTQAALGLCKGAGPGSVEYVLAATELSHSFTAVHCYCFQPFIWIQALFELIFGVEMEALLENMQNRNCLLVRENPALGKLESECGVPEP